MANEFEVLGRVSRGKKAAAVIGTALDYLRKGKREAVDFSGNYAARIGRAAGSAAAKSLKRG